MLFAFVSIHFNRLSSLSGQSVPCFLFPVFPESSMGLSSHLLNNPIHPEGEIRKDIYVEKLNLTPKGRGTNLCALFGRRDHWLRERIGGCGGWKIQQNM